MEQMQWLLGHNHDDAQSGKKKFNRKKAHTTKKKWLRGIQRKEVEQFLMNLFADMVSCVW